jgi:predicted alpha-1,6-mannanase (GH76 family)
MVANLVTATSVLSEGPNCGGTDCPQFKGIGYRHLAALQKVSPQAAYLEVLRASAKAVGTLAVQQGTGLHGTAWQGPAPAPGETINIAQESAAVVPLVLYHSALTP